MSRYIDIEYLKKKKRFLTAQQRYIVRMTDIYNAPSIDLDIDVWCEDCKEYDKEHHNCPRFNRVIRTALEDAGMVSVVRCEMSRYIDADNLEEKKFVEAETHGQGEHIAYRVGWNNAIEAICENEPTIDIVRCKECKWSKANGTYQWCGRLDSTARITADDFCSYGEREGE